MKALCLCGHKIRFHGRRNTGRCPKCQALWRKDKDGIWATKYIGMDSVSTYFIPYWILKRKPNMNYFPRRTGGVNNHSASVQ